MAKADNRACRAEAASGASDWRRQGRRVGRSCERSERLAKADVAQLAERVLGKDEVTSSILVIGSSLRSQLRRELRLGRPARQTQHGQATEGGLAEAPEARRRMDRIDKSKDGSRGVMGAARTRA